MISKQIKFFGRVTSEIELMEIFSSFNVLFRKLYRDKLQISKYDAIHR